MDSTPRRYAFVTGTSRGLGAAVASALLDGGWNVVGISRSAAPAAVADHALYRHEGLDLADLRAVEQRFEGSLARLVADARPAAVALVNNAATLDLVHTGAQGLADLQAAATVNSVVPTWLMGWALRAVPAATPLTIVNVSSGAATRAYPGWSSYCQTKAALLMAGQVLAEELAEVPALADRPVAVVSYAPGVVATEMQAAIRAADPEHFPRRRRFEELHAGGELVEPAAPAAEIAELCGRAGLPAHSVLRFGG